METKPRVCRYVRKSRDDGQGETLEETLARHMRMTDAMAADKGFCIEETYQEVVSGASISERPEMIRLLHDIKDGKWDIVVVVDISRLSRGDGSDQTVITNAFRLTKTRCYSDWKIYDLDNRDDLELFERKLQNSRIEYKEITRRLNEGVNRSVADGYRCAPAPYGLRLAGTRRRYTLEKNELFPNYMLAMEYWHDDPNPTWYGLQKLFHERGIMSPRGREWWSATSLEYMVMNDAYLGYSVWGVHKTESFLGEDFSEVKREVISDDPKRFDAAWPPFIDREYAAEARARIRRKPPVNDRKELTNPLAGLLRCSKCGHAMMLRFNRRHWYFQHADWGLPRTCNCKAVQSSALMDLLVNSLKDMLEQDEITLSDDGTESRIAKLKADAEAMGKEIERSEKSLIDAYYRLDRGVIDERVYESVSQMENGRIERLKASIAEAEKEIATADREHIGARVVSLRDMLTALNDGSLTPFQVNAILKCFIDRIEYTNYAPPRTREQNIHLDIFLRG